eukprot:scaffold7330_cov146-Cylindrotheca_fusiformis.AAC.10
MGLFGFKGPKELLSSAIATNLGTYFEVDQEKIESNLLADTKIVLHDAKLKDQTKVIQTFGDLETGRSSVVHVTGTVEEVIFSWKWSVLGSDKAWVHDATLTIRGLHFKANLSWWDNKTVQEKIPQDTPAPSTPAPSKPNNKTKKEESAMQHYIKQQVAMIIDSLKLQIEDYKFIVEMEPLPIDGVSDTTTSVIVGGKAVNVISMGRHNQIEEQGGFTNVETKTEDGEKTKVSIAAGKSNVETLHADTSKLPLEQMFVMDSFSVMMHASNSEPEPILDNFSYKAKSVRLTGERFLTGMGTGLVVTGDPPAEGKLNFYAGEKQIHAMRELSGYVLAPAIELPDDDADPAMESGGEDEEPSQGIEVPLDGGKADDSIVSSFEFPLNAVSLHLDSTNLIVSSLAFRYRADGTVAEITADRVDVDSSSEDPRDKICFATQGIRASLRPSIILELDTVESLRVPDAIQLTEPTKNVSFQFNEGMLKMRFESIHAQQLEAREKEKPPKASEDEIKPNWKAALPFPVNICAKDIHLANAYNIKKVTELNGLELDVAPGIDVAIILQRAHNDLYDIEDIAVTALVPVDKDGVIEKLHVAAAKTVLTAGRSAHEWEDRLESRPKKKKTESVNYKLPFAHIEPLSLNVSFNGIVSTKDNKLVTRPFKGNEKTTQEDLVKHYTSHILGKVPGFITHAEILGINLVDTGASTYGSWALSATAFGPLGGLAGITGVDAVKGTIAAGKRSRKANSETADDNFHATDIFRGFVQAAKEATEAGAASRGKQAGQGGVVDWAYGATSSTQNYAKENKSRLGATAAGGAGFLAGAMMLGPAAPVALPFAAGLLASKATGDALKKREEKAKAKKAALEAAKQ